MVSNNLHHHHYHLLATTIAVLGTLFSSILITTTAYAQPQLPQQSRACPSGFELNRGVCQAEPSEIVYSCDEGTLNGNECEIITSSSDPICPDASFDLYEFITVVYEGDIAIDYTDVCLHIKSLGPPDIVAPDCLSEDQQFNPDTNKCEGTTTVPATPTQECDTGKLNEDSGMCEVKPGRGNR